MNGLSRSFGWLMIFLPCGTDAAFPVHLDLTPSTNGRVVLSLSGESHGVYRVDHTADFNGWTVLTTNEDRASQRTLDLPSPEARRFYRTVRLPVPKFRYALATQRSLDIHGNSLEIDSFDSSDPFASTNQGYDPTKSTDRAEIAAASGIIDTVRVGQVKLKGFVLTLPGAAVSIGPNGSIGSSAWLDAFNRGIQPGHAVDDLVLNIPTNQAPFTAGLVPASGEVNGQLYDYVLGDGDYYLSSLSLGATGRLAVTGDAVLYVTGNIHLSGNACLQLLPGAGLELYVGEAGASQTQIDLGGLGVLNSGPATRFRLYALPSVTHLNLSQNEPFVGLISAPQTTVVIGPAGQGVGEFVGSCVAWQLLLDGHLKVHYDEAILRHGPVE